MYKVTITSLLESNWQRYGWNCAISWLTLPVITDTHPMSDQVVSQKLTLPFGDVIKRVAYAIHSQLQNVLHNMRIQSPELRTQSLISFISRSKKKLAQLLAITRWLDIPAVSQFFANMSQLQSKIAGLENRLNENQDALYFTHSQLFCCRIRSLDVVSAKDILARGAYPHLPASMFRSGTAHRSSYTDGGIMSDNFLQKSLNIYLRSKVTLRDCVPSDIDQSSIDNGLLTVKVNNMYELILTLDYLDTDAPWNILKFSICVSSHRRESFNSRQNLSAIENNVLFVLRSITTALNSTPAKTEEFVMQSDLTTVNKIESGSASNGDVDVLTDRTAADSSLVSPSIVDSSYVESHRAIAVPMLPRLHIICQHAANASALRYLYIQALETSRSVLMGLGEADFQEKTKYSQFVFRFWSSRVTSNYKYELRVIQLRSPTQMYNPLDIEIIVVDSYGKEIGGDVGLAADSRNFNRDYSTASASSNSGGSNSSGNFGSSSSSNSDSSRRSGVEGISDIKEFPESSSPPCQAPTLIVELWTLSAPDDSDGSSRVTRRRVRQKSILGAAATPDASTGSTSSGSGSGSTSSGSSSASTVSSSEEISQSATINETFSNNKFVETAESLFDISEFITDGVTFGGMFHRIVEMSGENMLSVLYHRFLSTPSIMTYLSHRQVSS